MEAEAIFNSKAWKTLPDEKFLGKHIFAIGKTTLNTLRSLGIRVSEPSGKSDIEGLLRAIESEYC